MRPPQRRRFLLVAFTLLLAAGGSAWTQLYWGTSGAGGDGVWGLSANWWNGSQNVTYDGSGAIFAGSGGTVTVSPNVSVFASSMRFDSPGYTLNGRLTVQGNTPSITANVDATINTPFNENIAGSILTKYGSGTVTTNLTGNLSNFVIQNGVVRGSTFYPKTKLGNAPDVVLSLIGPTPVVNGLSGGGSQGGFVQPDSATTPLTVTLQGVGSFGGVLRDRGAAQLSVNLDPRTDNPYLQFGYVATNLTLTNANTYSGATTVTTSELNLSGGGSILNTPSVSLSRSKLSLDSTALPLGNRIPDAIAIALDNSALIFTGNANTPVTEILGNVTVAGYARILVNQPGAAAARLELTGFTQSPNSVLQLGGTGRVKIPGLSNTAGGILPPTIAWGSEYFATDWASVGADGTIGALSNYQSLSAGGAMDHVKIPTGTTQLATGGARYSLNLQKSGSTAAILDLGGNTLMLNGGAILSQGSNSIRNGTVLSGTSTLVVNAGDSSSAFTIAARISDQDGPTTLLKTGFGTLALQGANTYTGNTQIASGTLAISSGQSLGLGENIEFVSPPGNGATLQAEADFSADKNIIGLPGSVVTFQTKGHTMSFNGTIAPGMEIVQAYSGPSGTVRFTAPDVGKVTVQGGTLALAGVATGTISLGSSGILDATGHLDKVSVTDSYGALMVGSGGIGSLTIDELYAAYQFSIPLKLELQLDRSDYLDINSFSSLAGTLPRFVVDFKDLGGAQAGFRYRIFGAGPGGVTASNFSLSQANLAAGWQASFGHEGDDIMVSFASVPEPSSAALLACAAGVLACRRRRRASSN